MVVAHALKERVAMSQATTSARLPEATSASPMGMTALFAWQAVLGLALSGVAFWQLGQVFSGTAENALIAAIFGIVSAILGIISLVSVPFILRRDHRGRLMSLGGNYLVFFAVFFGLLNRIGFFVGLDDLADTFGRGLPLLAVVLIGYLITSLGDKDSKRTERDILIQRIGWGIAAVCMAIAIFLMGGINAVQTLLTRIFSDPFNIGLLLLTGALVTALWFLWRSPTAATFNAKVSDTETSEWLSSAFAQPHWLPDILPGTPRLFALCQHDRMVGVWCTPMGGLRELCRNPKSECFTPGGSDTTRQ